jgi:hypothetical protein
MYSVWVGWSRNSISQHLGKMLEVLRVVNVDFRRLIIAGTAAPLKCELQVAVSVERLEAGDDVVAANKVVQRPRNSMKSVGVRRLFRQRGLGPDEETVLFQTQDVLEVIQTASAIGQPCRA